MNNIGAQDFVIGGDLIVSNGSGIQVHTNGNKTRNPLQSVEA
jgi:hypothetical protein